MTALSEETRNVQNPALGATLLWSFACGYTESHRVSESPPLQLLFLVLPIVLHAQTDAFVKGTNKSSGLRAFAAKFGEASTAKQDLLLAIHDRSLRLRALTLDSLRLAISTRLLHLEVAGRVSPLSRTRAEAGLSAEAKQLLRDAGKLGVWCAPLTVHEIATTLKVRF